MRILHVKSLNCMGNTVHHECTNGFGFWSTVKNNIFTSAKYGNVSECLEACTQSTQLIEHTVMCLDKEEATYPLTHKYVVSPSR